MFKRFLIAAALLLGCGCFSFGQGFRIGDSFPISSSLTTPGQISTVSNALIAVCTFPANAVPCTNKATTFTSVTLGTPCSTSTQIVLAGTSTCVSSTDGRGNWGAWVAQGNYDFTVTVSTGQSFGPFTISVGIAPATNLTLGALTVNTSLLPGATGTVPLGNSSFAFFDVCINSGAAAAVCFTDTGATVTRLVNAPDAAGTLVLDTAVQTLTNKTLTSPAVTGLSTTTAITSTLAPGTAPFIIASTTPIANLTVQNCGATCAITQPTISTGISQGSGFKHQRFAGNLGGTCPTGGAVGNACTSANLNWTSAFADNNYSVTCSLEGAMTAQPHIVNVTKQAAGAGITLTIAADTAAAANVAPTGFVDCVAAHD